MHKRQRRGTPTFPEAGRSTTDSLGSDEQGKGSPRCHGVGEGFVFSNIDSLSLARTQPAELRGGGDDEAGHSRDMTRLPHG